MTAQAQVDEAKLQQFMGTLIGYMSGAAACFGMLLGDELGLYRALADGGPLSADALSDLTLSRRLCAVPASAGFRSDSVRRAAYAARHALWVPGESRSTTRRANGDDYHENSRFSLRRLIMVRQKGETCLT